MFHDIAPHLLNNQFESKKVTPKSVILCFSGNNILIGYSSDTESHKYIPDETDDFVEKAEHKLLLPTVRQLKIFNSEAAVYAFSIDETAYFLYFEDIATFDIFEYVPTRSLRQLTDMHICFAVMTGLHLYRWYCDNKFCGRCGSKTTHDKKERMLYCPECHNAIYPKIAPAVIVALTSGDKILMTKYADREYKKYALLAGFTEIGETAEETVKREVMEEVGLKVKNIRYYKSQPWGIDQNLLLGFFCELDGDDNIEMDESELALAEWVSRDNMPAHDDGISLTREMMHVFEEGKEISF